MVIGKILQHRVTHIVNELIWDMVLDSVDDNTSNEIWELVNDELCSSLESSSSEVLHKILYEYEYR